MTRSALALTVAAVLAPLCVAQSGPTTFSGSNSTQIVNVIQNSTGFALKSSTPSSSAISALFGKATNSSGYTAGVWGQSFSLHGVGVRGEAKASTGGIGGAFYSYSPNGTAVFGSACSQSSLSNCTGIAVHGVVNGLNTDATAGVFEISGSDGGGNLLLGIFDGAHVFRVGEQGDLYADGGVHTQGADFAESFTVRGEPRQYQPGDVLVIDPDHDRRVSLSQDSYSTLVAGIYSTRPGVLAAPHTVGETNHAPEIPMAMVGVVPTKVTASNGPIRRGDLLVTSSRAGYAMKGTDATRMTGAILGKALQPLDHGDGTIEVLVTLH